MPSSAKGEVVQKKSIKGKSGRSGAATRYVDRRDGRTITSVSLSADDADGRGGRCTETWIDYRTKPHQHLNPGMLINCSGGKRGVSGAVATDYPHVAGMSVIVCEAPTPPAGSPATSRTAAAASAPCHCTPAGATTSSNPTATALPAACGSGASDAPQQEIGTNPANWATMPVSRRLLVAALALVGVTALSAVMARRDSGGGEDPFRRAVTFLGGEQSADFDGTLQLGTPPGPTRDTRIRGKIGLPDRSLDLLGDDAITVIVTVIGDRVYESRGGMPSTYELGPSPAGHSLSVWRPAELRRMLGSLEAVTVADRTIRGRVPLSALVTTPLPGQADVELTVDSNGRPERLQWQMDVDSARSVEIRGDVTYKGWTARKADIATPEEIENSPDVDEERLAAFEHGPVLAPTGLPVGYELTDLFLLEGDGLSCAKAELEYFQPDRYFGRYVLRVGSIDAPRLSIAMSPRSCTTEPLPAGTPFVAGGIRGTIAAHARTQPDVEPFRFFYADVGTLRIKVETNLPEGDVLTAIGSLAPIDLATQPVHQGRDIGDDDPLAILDSLVRYAVPTA